MSLSLKVEHLYSLQLFQAKIVPFLLCADFLVRNFGFRIFLQAGDFLSHYLMESFILCFLVNDLKVGHRCLGISFSFLTQVSFDLFSSLYIMVSVSLTFVLQTCDCLEEASLSLPSSCFSVFACSLSITLPFSTDDFPLRSPNPI